MPGALNVSPGSELGRYTVGSRLDAGAPAQRWTARDGVLGRDVTLLVMPAGEPTTDAALDAARRAAGVDAVQLVRIHDVGTDGEVSYIAEDHVDGTSFADLVGDQGLPAEEVRRIVGEVATGIEAARTRGLHHLALTPGSVLLTSAGEVKLRGLATESALADVDLEGEEATREDATAVVALAYAGLTGAWPLPSDTGGLRRAVRAGGVLPAPSHEVAGVPGDLDTICRETLNDDAGPDSPGDLARQIAPWSRRPVTAASTSDSTSWPGAAGDPDETTRPRVLPVDDQPTRPLRTVRTPQDRRAADSGTAGAAAVSAAGADGASRAGTAGGDGGTEVGRGAEPEGITEPEDGTQPIGVAGDSTPKPGSDIAARASAAAAGAAAAAAAGGKALGGRVGRLAQKASERGREVAEDRSARREAIRADVESGRSLGATPTEGPIGAPVPLLPVGDGEPPSREQSRTVLALMAGFVVIALLVAIFGVSRIGSGSDLGSLLGGDSTLPAPTTSSAPASSDTDTGGSAGGEPYAILSAVGFDPAGDGVENNAEADRIHDGDPATAWNTEGYFDPDFGNKPGVGVVVDLGQERQINSVTLSLPTTANATVYVGDEATNSGTEIGSTEGQSGEVTLDASTPPTGRFVTVWFTTTVPSDDGRNRASLAEITVR